MSYSCSDFVDSILLSLKIDLTDDEKDDPAAQATKALAAIADLEKRTRIARALLGDLIDWDTRMGGFEAKIWRKARDFYSVTAPYHLED